MAGGQMKAVYSTPWSKRRPKPKTIKGKIKKAIKKVNDKNFKKKVLSVVRAQVETKQAFGNLPFTAFNSGINASGDLQWCLPNISQGTAENARVGDQIRALKLNIRGAIVSNLTYQAYSDCRIAIRMMIVSPKAYPTLASAQANATTWLATLLRKGGTTSNFTGAMEDLWAPINTEAITKYYDKVFYVNSPYMATAVGEQPTYNSVKFFNINMKLRNKLLKYDSSVGSGITPTNYGPILLLGYAHLDGSSGDTLTTQVGLSFDTIFDYEDA